MLNNGTVTANIPAGDLKRAREFYNGTLGLTPAFEMEGVMLVYKTTSGSTFSVYETQYAGQAGHTIAQGHVDDVEQEVTDLKAKGVTFEEYDLPGMKTVNGIAEIGGFKGAWFKDPEGNILSVVNMPSPT